MLYHHCITSISTTNTGSTTLLKPLCSFFTLIYRSGGKYFFVFVYLRSIGKDIYIIYILKVFNDGIVSPDQILIRSTGKDIYVSLFLRNVDSV